MDPFYGYGDNYSGSGDPSSDPNYQQHQSWSNQWTTAPTTAVVQQQQAAAGGFPQYVSQQQQQAQHQAQQTFAAMNPNSLSNFMQQQQKSQFQQHKLGQHGPVGTPKPPHQHQLGVGGGPGLSSRSFGAFGSPSTVVGAGLGSAGGAPRGILNQEWIVPASSQPAAAGAAAHYGVPQSALRTFPSKSGGGGPHGGNKPHWKQQKGKGHGQHQQHPAAPKKTVTAGKTPAMILHEVFKEIEEVFTEVDSTNPKRYLCSLTVNGRQFQMDSPNKKMAKQKCAELVVRTLRPDLHVAPFGDGAAANAPKPATPTKRNAEENSATAPTPPPAKKQNNSGNAKKKETKLAPVELAVSLTDLMMRLIVERGAEGKLTPLYEAVELPPRVDEQQEQQAPPIVPKEEPLDMDEQDEANEKKKKNSNKKDKDRIRKPEVQVEYTLRFKELEGKVWTKTGTNRGMLKDMVIREALRDFFAVSQDDIVRVARRFAMNRLTKEMNLAQCLYSTCSILNCSVALGAEPAEDRPLGEGRMYFMGRCTVTDHNLNDKVVETKSGSLQSKALAKDYAAQEMLKTYFNIDPNGIGSGDGNGNVQQGAASLLHAMLNKKTKQKTQIEYEFKDNVPPVAGVKQPEPIFYCDCVIDTERFTGQGRSKKLAKNNAAEVALKRKFDIDYDPTKSYPLAHSYRPEKAVSQLCVEIAEFCKREYHQATEHHQVQQSNYVAAFVLINESNHKRLLSMGSSSQQYVVEPDNLNGANGNHIVHFDPIVLARRGLLRMLCNEILCSDSPSSIFDVKEDGRVALKDNLKLCLYSQYSPCCKFGADDAPKKSLAIVKHLGLSPVPNETLDVHEIRKTKDLRVHCVADKLLKWNTIGVQGGLLSNVMHPLFISHIFFGSRAALADDSLKFAMCNRLPEATPPGIDRPDVNLESIQHDVAPRIAAPHLWFRSMDAIEVLSCNTGRTANGAPSKVCKAELLENYLRLPNVSKGEVNYAKEKERAANYQYEKKVFYNKLEAAQLGKWQQKPSELADDFVMISSDE